MLNLSETKIISTQQTLNTLKKRQRYEKWLVQANMLQGKTTRFTLKPGASEHTPTAAKTIIFLRKTYVTFKFCQQ